MSLRRRQEKLLAACLLAPALALVAILGALPILSQVALSLFQRNLRSTGRAEFVGLENYLRLLRDEVFWRDFGQTCEFTFFSVSLELLLGLGAALLLYRMARGRPFMGAVLILPWALPTVVAATMWSLILSDRLGLLNQLLIRAGVISQPVLWLGKSWAMPAVIMTDVWKTTPFVALILVAGLRSISLSCYEAARIDGAGAWQMLRFIMLPLLKPFIAVALLFRIMDAFRVFDLVWVLTAGAHGTETLSVYIYRLLFRYGEVGGGAAAAVSLFVAVLGLSALLLRLLSVQVKAAEV